MFLKINKSVYIAKLGQRYDKTLDNFLLHVPNHALKDMCMLNYGILYYVLIDLINCAIILHVFYKQLSVWKLPYSCLLNSISASGRLMISATWSINFQMVLLFLWAWVHSVQYSSTKRVACWAMSFSLSCLNLGTI